MQAKKKALNGITRWIRKQKGGLNYWEIIKGELAIKSPEFREWLKNNEE